VGGDTACPSPPLTRLLPHSCSEQYSAFQDNRTATSTCFQLTTLGPWHQPIFGIDTATAVACQKNTTADRVANFCHRNNTKLHAHTWSALWKWRIALLMGSSIDDSGHNEWNKGEWLCCRPHCLIPQRLMSPGTTCWDVSTDQGWRSSLTGTTTVLVHQNRLFSWPQKLWFLSGLSPLAYEENKHSLTRQWGTELKKMAAQNRHVKELS